MKKIYMLLILLCFSLISPSLFADGIDIMGKLGDPTKDRDAQPGYRDNFDSWDMEKRIKNNFIGLQTVPMYSNQKLDLEVGPAQFFIRIPL